MPGLLWEMQNAQLEADRPQGIKTSTGIYFPCTDNNVDVQTKVSGSTHTLLVAGRPVAELTPTDESTLIVRRGAGAYAGEVTVGLVGSARWLVKDLGSVQIQVPGMKGSVTIRYGRKPDELLFMRFGMHVDVPRTKVIRSTARTDRVRMCNATTASDLVAALPPAARALQGDLDRLSGLTYPRPGFAVPTLAEAGDIQQAFADVTKAIASGEFEKAIRLCRGLGIPSPSDAEGLVDVSQLTTQEWKAFVALGGLTFTGAGPHVDTKAVQLNAIQGTGHYVTLIDDMAECGVDPLGAPPTFDQIHQYYANARLEASDGGAAAVTARLLVACQRVMSGMQVHYRFASDTKPGWGRVYDTFVYDKGKLLLSTDSTPLPFASPADVSAYESAHKGSDHFTTGAEAPRGYDVTVSHEVYGRRYDSDCSGMGSFRLRTLPPGFDPVGVVIGQPPGPGRAHLVAVFSSPDRKLYLSSNGKPPILVPPDADGRYDADRVQRAVAAEFTSIYHGQRKFDYGVAGATGPGGETPADRNPVIDRIFHDANVDMLLRRHEQDRKLSGPATQWSVLAPWWSYQNRSA